ncbi:MAG TPA: T9SS type A sorting domain-containing protein [Chitinophagaceae bacterium]|nr:T9SS type A sorting domain-containing protein [Chitinophagaceae bacterium]
MKYAGIFLPVYLLLPTLILAQQGSTCSNPYPLTLDGVCRDYAISSSTANGALCSYGNLHVTYFSFTPASSKCVLINVTDPAGQPCEAALYAGGSCSGGSLESNSSMCLADGNGLWAPAYYLNGAALSPTEMQAGTTYVVRIQTTTSSGNITLCAQYDSPTNNLCSGATAIGTTPLVDNNACNMASSEVAPIDLAAGTLENTAFYKFTVASTGSVSIILNNVDCDNGTNAADGSANGIQVGIFTGSCGSLTRIDRFTNNYTSDTRWYPSLPAGTDVYVAIDGVSGSNCSYSLSATNSVTLPVYVEYFTAWKTPTSNVLKWVSLEEMNNDHYEIQRSADGQHFYTIGRIKGEILSTTKKTYTFEDARPPMKCFYRLVQVDIDNRERIYKTIAVVRSEIPYITLNFQNPVADNLLLSFQTNAVTKAQLSIVSMSGSIVLNKTILCNDGDNRVLTNLSSLPAGKYIISLKSDDFYATKTFIKMN